MHTLVWWVWHKLPLGRPWPPSRFVLATLPNCSSTPFCKPSVYPSRPCVLQETTDPLSVTREMSSNFYNFTSRIVGRALEFVWLRSLSMVAWRPNGDCVGLRLTPSYCCLTFLCMSTPVWLFTVDTWTVSNVWALREKLPPPSVYNSLHETQPSFLSSYLECLGHTGREVSLGKHRWVL